VKGFLILVKPSRQSDCFPDKTLDVPGIHQPIRSVMELLFKEKIIFLLRNLSPEGTEVLLLLALGTVLGLVAVLRLL
jgi:hypothetical protein